MSEGVISGPSGGDSRHSDPVSMGQDSVRVPFKFHGEGGEYFRIWIVNIVLTILTLGIYSAWATVRTKRYFYGNTELDGDRFDYLGQPIAILKGRLLAVGLLLLYQALLSFGPPALSGLVTLLLFAALPWIIYRALRFNAHMSSWRGVRFGFDGDWGGAAKAFLLWPLFGVVTLGFGMPYAWYKQNQYLLSNYRFGASSSTSTTEPADFYALALAVLGFALVGGLLLVLLTSLLGVSGFAADEDFGFGALGTFVVLLVGGAYFVYYIMIFAVYQARYFQTVYNNIELADNYVGTSVSIMGLGKIVLSNTILVLITLGFYFPWAQVRMTQYLQDNLWVDAVDLDSFVAKSGDESSALGEEIGEAFDLGIGI